MRQYEAAGHAVRAAYLLLRHGGRGHGDRRHRLPERRAVASGNNIVNKKYYVTGGIGSGETSEGFGANYSLPNNAYCESCANCGDLVLPAQDGR